MMDRIRIQLLGGFTVLVNDRDFSAELNVSKKGAALLQLLILQRGFPVSNRSLHEALWSESKSRKPDVALKTLVSRYRHELGAISETLGDCIRTVRDGYAFDPNLGISVDYFELNALRDALAGSERVTDANRGQYERLFRLYRGDLLADRNGSEAWARPVQVSLHSEVFALLYRYVEDLMRRESYDEAIAACRRLLEIDCFDEQLHIALMDSLQRVARVKDAISHYKALTELYHKYLGTQPPEALRSYYTNILNADKAMNENLSSICAELRRTEKLVGALVCEYAVFREIYMLQVRSSSRRKHQTYVVLIMLHRTDGSVIDGGQLEQMMSRLQTIVKFTLRRSDVVCRYGPNKFALLLPTKTETDCDLVMNRVKSGFYKEFGDTDVILSYRRDCIDYVQEEDKEEEKGVV